MSKNCTFIIASFLFIYLLSLISCQKDNFIEPEITPKKYSFNIPNKINFEFSQISKSRQSIIPYTNSLNIKNTSNDLLFSDYTLFAFKSNEKNYDNIAFIKKGNVSNLPINNYLNDIVLNESDALFSDENLIISILNFNNSSDHQFNGLYNGELNIFTPTAVDTTFVKSVTCIGIIDYQGTFNFFTQNEDENNIVRLKGSFNSNHLISGSILKRDNTTLSPIVNIITDTLKLESNNLFGNVKFTENTQERLLQFNLTKQN